MFVNVFVALRDGTDTSDSSAADITRGMGDKFNVITELLSMEAKKAQAPPR
jgi:hypothetical protein